MPIRKPTPDEEALLSGGDQLAPPSSIAALPSPTFRSASTDELGKLGGSNQPQPQAKPTPSPSFLERLGGWRGLAGTAVRTGSGVLSSEGFWPGAAISGAGEALAQQVEGSGFSLPKIATESAFGAIPFGKIVKGGKVLGSALRSGALGAGHEIVSEGLGKNDMSGANIATAAGLGAVLGAGGSKLMKAAPEANKVKPGEFIVEPTAQPGGRVLPGTGKVTAKNPLQDVLAPPPIKATGDIVLPNPSLSSRIDEPTGNIPYYQEAPPPYRASTKATVAAEAKAAKEAKAAEQVATTRAGMEAGTPSSSDTFSTPNAQGGTSSVRIPYRVPKDAAEAAQLGVSGPRTPSTPSTPSSANPLADFLAGTPTPAKYVAPPEVSTPGIRNIGENVTPISENLPLGDKLVPDIQGPPITAASSAAAKADMEAAHAQQQQAWVDEVIAHDKELAAQDARSNFSVVPPTEAPPTPSPLRSLLQPGEQLVNPDLKNPGNPLLSRLGATGLNKASAIGTPGEAAARDAHLIELGRPPEGPLASHAQPSVSTPVSGTPNLEPSTPDWVKTQSDLVDRLKSEKGGISPGLLKVLSPVAGAAIGAPIGSINSPEDPGGGMLKGALAGGMIGGVAGGIGSGGGLKGLTDFRNAMLLAGPAQLKKPLSDLGGYIGLAAENAWNNPQLAKNLGKEALRLPTNISNAVKAFKTPELARDVIGDQALQNVPQSTGLLRQVTRPFAAAQYATQQAMERAGVTPTAAKEALMLGDPKTPVARWFLKSQSLPGVGGQVMRFLTPFKRIATNIAERGLERTPGPSLFMGPAETRTARTLTGAGAMAGGAITGASDEANAAEGNPTSPMVKGLRRASLASYGLPFALGESLGGSNALEVYNIFPGLREIVPPPGQGETVLDWLKKQGSHTLDQILPSILNLNKPGQGSGQ